MKAEILKILKKAEGYVSGQQLCEQLGVSRTAVWKAIRQLEEEGYVIEAVRNKGYRLVEDADVLTVAELRSVLDTKWLGQEVDYFYETDSTNNRARDAAEKGASHGYLAVADSQTGTQRQSVEFSAWNRYFYEFSHASVIWTVPGVHADFSSRNGSRKRRTESHRAECYDQMAK